LTARVSGPFVVADTVDRSGKASAKPALTCEQIPKFKANGESPGPLCAELTMPAAIDAIHIAPNLATGLTMKPAPLTLSSRLQVAVAKGRFEHLPASSASQLTSPQIPSHPPAARGWHKRTAVLPQTLNRLSRPVRAWYRRCLAGRDRCLTIFGSIDWPGLKRSVYRWLQQSSNPTQERLPQLPLVEARRRFPRGFHASSR
jgi:hypothetical protein